MFTKYYISNTNGTMNDYLHSEITNITNMNGFLVYIYSLILNIYKLIQFDLFIETHIYEYKNIRTQENQIQNYSSFISCIFFK